MAFDETLAARIRDMLRELGESAEERKMFGGLTFMVNGYMSCGVLRDDLVVKLAPDTASAAIACYDGVRPMDFTGRPMPGMLYVSPGAVSGEADLRRWVTEAAQFANAQPAKQARRPFAASQTPDQRRPPESLNGRPLTWGERLAAPLRSLAVARKAGIVRSAPPGPRCAPDIEVS